MLLPPHHDLACVRPLYNCAIKLKHLIYKQYSTFASYQDFRCHGWRKLGYLTQMDWGYALALIARLRREMLLTEQNIFAKMSNRISQKAGVILSRLNNLGGKGPALAR